MEWIIKELEDQLNFLKFKVTQSHTDKTIKASNEKIADLEKAIKKLNK